MDRTRGVADTPKHKRCHRTEDLPGGKRVENLSGGKRAEDLSGGKRVENLSGGKRAEDLSGGKRVENLSGGKRAEDHMSKRTREEASPPRLTRTTGRDPRCCPMPFTHKAQSCIQHPRLYCPPPPSYLHRPSPAVERTPQPPVPALQNVPDTDADSMALIAGDCTRICCCCGNSFEPHELGCSIIGGRRW